MTSSMRVRKRRLGRPLIGDEPLDERITVMVTTSMKHRVEAVSGGHVGSFIRGLLEEVLGKDEPAARASSGPAKRRRVGRRYGR